MEELDNEYYLMCIANFPEENQICTIEYCYFPECSIALFLGSRSAAAAAAAHYERTNT
jgi:hypothetical protein